jgi:hypothetical protein
MKSLGDLLAVLLVCLIILFFFKGDELLDSYAKYSVAAAQMCRLDPTCHMTFTNYEDLVWAQEYINESE